MRLDRATPLAAAHLKKKVLSFQRHIDTFSRRTVILDTTDSLLSSGQMKTRCTKRFWEKSPRRNGSRLFSGQENFRPSSSLVECGKANASALPL